MHSVAGCNQCLCWGVLQKSQVLHSIPAHRLDVVKNMSAFVQKNVSGVLSLLVFSWHLCFVCQWAFQLTGLQHSQTHSHTH